MYQARLEADVRKWIEIARIAYPNKTIPMPTVIINNRLKIVAGRARSFYNGDKPIVEFSRAIIEDNGYEAVSSRTIPHEVAHICEFAIWHTGGHGQTFKHIMRNVFKIDADKATRCHNFEVRRNPKQTVAYVCMRCGEPIALSLTRHNRAVKGGFRYNHKACGGIISLVEVSKR